MKTIRISDELHKKIIDRKDSEFTSADLVIGWLFEQEQAVAEHNEAFNDLLKERDELKHQKIMDEGELLKIILDDVNKLTCENCGETLISEQSVKTNDQLGMMHLDPGSRNYPHEPDEPAGIYFECVNCMNEV